MGLRSRLESRRAYRELMDEEYPYRRIGDAVMRLRADRGVTQEELARLADTTQSVVARLESGKHRVRVDLLNRIAAALDMTWHPVFEPRVDAAPNVVVYQVSSRWLGWEEPPTTFFEGKLQIAPLSPPDAQRQRLREQGYQVLRTPGGLVPFGRADDPSLPLTRPPAIQ